MVRVLTFASVFAFDPFPASPFHRFTASPSFGASPVSVRGLAVVYFEILDDIINIELIATGNAIRDRSTIERQYGSGKWRKLKGTATVRLANGKMRRAEEHWYEAHGIGRKKFKIKRFLGEI